jgi:uncharacterized membrane protein
LGTPDTGQRQTNKKTIQGYCQHWVHQTQDRDKQTKPQYRDTVNIGYTRHRTETNSISVLCFLFVCLCPVSGVPNVDSISVLCFCLFVSVLCLVYPMLTVSLYWVHQTQDRDKQTKKHNKEILSTLGTPDTGQRQTNKNTTQRYCQQCTQCWQYLCIVFFVCLSLSCVWCTQCWQYLCVVFCFCLSLSCVWCTQCWLSTLGTPDTEQRQTNQKHNTEILSTLGTPDTGQRQTNKNTTQKTTKTNPTKTRCSWKCINHWLL